MLERGGGSNKLNSLSEQLPRAREQPGTGKAACGIMIMTSSATMPSEFGISGLPSIQTFMVSTATRSVEKRPSH